MNFLLFLLLSLNHFSVPLHHRPQLRDECDLPFHITFCHALQLSFAYHVHHLESLSCSPCCLKREKAHPWLRQAFDKPMILFDQIVEIFDLPQFAVFGDVSLRFEFCECFGRGCVFVHVDHPWFVGRRGGERFEKELLGGLRISGRAEKEIKRVSL